MAAFVHVFLRSLADGNVMCHVECNYFSNSLEVVRRCEVAGAGVTNDSHMIRAYNVFYALWLDHLLT